jgi:glycosyltransferase involved in cell wall biosynthesis
MAVDSGAMVLGRVLNKELYKYYSAADVYVLFALRDDYFGGTGIATLESLACNTPVVSYALRNYIGNNIKELGETPDSIEKYRQAILKVIDNPGAYKNMSESVFNNYSYNAVYNRLKNLLKELSEQETK